MLTVRITRPLVAVPVKGDKAITLPVGTVIERLNDLPDGTTYVLLDGRWLIVIGRDLIDACETIEGG